MTRGGAELVASVQAGLRKGYLPELTKEGSSGAYYVFNAEGKKVAVFKPRDEEPGAENNPREQRNQLLSPSERGIRVGGGAAREKVAYVLDHPMSGPRLVSEETPGFSGVPLTVLVTLPLERGGTSVPVYGSLQKYVESKGDCDYYGPDLFQVDEVHKIAVLDIRMANTDRHEGNILVRIEGENYHLEPIDHGYCLPEQFKCCRYIWLNWRQAEEHFSDETRNYIASLDAEKDIAMLKADDWKVPSQIARTLRISTMLLKKGAESNLTPYDIGNIMCREKEEEQSTIEKIVEEAINESEDDFLDLVYQKIDSHLEEFVASKQPSGSTAGN